MHLIGVFARPVLPGIKIGDKVMPLLAMKVLPSWLAGIVLAAPMAAIMSTVDALLILVSSAVVKDVYLNYLNPSALGMHPVVLPVLLSLIAFIIASLFTSKTSNEH